MDCHSSSSCHLPNYRPSKQQLSDLNAIQQLTECLHKTYIYRNADQFCRVNNPCNTTQSPWLSCQDESWYSCLFSVPWHLLCGVIQPYDAVICSKACAFLHSYLQDEDEPGCSGLGIFFLWHWVLFTYSCYHIHLLEWECEPAMYQPAKGQWSSQTGSPHSHEGASGEDIQLRWYTVGILLGSQQSRLVVSVHSTSDIWFTLLWYT